MKCPHCEIGTVTKIYLKRADKTGYLCDNCDTLWREGEQISQNTGAPLDLFTRGEQLDYVFVDKTRQEEEPVRIMSDVKQ